MAGFFVLIVWAGIGLLLPACHPLSPGRPLAGFDRSSAAPPAGKLGSPASPLIALGDSITAAGPWSEAFPGRAVLNAGIPGNTTVDLLGRLDALPGLGGATVVLMAGINDLLQGEAPAPVADRILRIRRELLARGASRVVVVATLPCEAARLGPPLPRPCAGAQPPAPWRRARRRLPRSHSLAGRWRRSAPFRGGGWPASRARWLQPLV
ncbi:MAG: GDSL-type esterase/lipase family protein [Cyanobacteria bacterium]|nr:GDSL-type esterase/lipase family protein [Cyanobacteriota bacterium]